MNININKSINSISKEYAIIFNGVTEILEDLEIVKRKLIMYQQLAEEAFINTESEEITDSKVNADINVV